MNFIAKQSKLLVLFFISIVYLASCATPKISFHGKNEGGLLKAQIMQFSGDDQDTADIRDLPIEFTPDELTGKYVLITNSIGNQQRWFFPEIAGDTAKVIVDLQGNLDKDDDDKDRVNSTVERINRSVRLVLRAYQYITLNKVEEAIGLAEQAAKIANELAGPQIVLGVALLKKGEREAARQAWAKAKGLDPSDDGIDQLIESVE